MNHSGFTAELQERELYNSQETGWCGTNIHQAQILDYLPLLGSCQEKHPLCWTACEWIQPWGTAQQMESFCPPCQGKLGCLVPSLPTG